MKKKLCLVLAALLVVSLVGCGQEPTVVGTWEEEITVSVLGVTEKEGTYPALLRYTFAEDGSGVREVIQDVHPEDPQTELFTYSVEGDKLIITVTSTTQGSVPFEYTIKSLTSDSLELYFYGVTNSLKRVR